MPPKDKYSDPKLRDQVKEEIHNSDKGGAPGQWSARKAQMMAAEYKKRGGGYNTDESQKDSSQKNLDNWTKEEWQTKEGSGHAKEADGTEKRYLPKKAWEKMSEEEKEETERKKEKGSKQGKQYVANTESAKESRKEASEEHGDEEEEEEKEEKEERGEDDDDDDAAADEGSEEEAYVDDEEAEDDQNGEEEDEDEETNDDDDDTVDEQNASKPGQKRKPTQESNGTSSNKKQKSNSGKSTIGSKHMDAEEPAPRGSKDRLPKKGQEVAWKAMPGYVDGKVEEILTKDKNVDGKSVKASKDDPKIVLTSNKSGKICVHKPDACFYE
ncbi:Hypothetical predicted protein [Lecanosticta acicola]|uniref:Hypervirulence associated protein TUDOR domain-containing protein n=1 Tax=Lecanosticta acicola TaxID=111012 RepID=A0AAI9EAG1_9PEZI|nr:Hypothetical predicted protein [Lecanosticta acicola]